MSGRGMPAIPAAILRAVRRALRQFETERHDDGESITALWEGRLTFDVWEDELDGGWVAECPEFPGAMAQGESEHEALNNLAEVVTSIIEIKIEDALPDKPPADDDGGERHRGSYSVAL